MIDDSYRSTATAIALKQRSHLLRKLRDFFFDSGFDEVQTPILSQDIVIDRHLDPLIVEIPFSPKRHSNWNWYLQTSPEQNMKRLLASGLQAIFQIGPVFRAGEVGDLHNPEFTMVEWYRVGDDLERGIQFLEAICRLLLEVPTVHRSTFQDVFQRWVGIDPLVRDESVLSRYAIERGYVASTHWSNDVDDWIDLLFSHDVQPKLGHEAPLVVSHFPATQAALAKLSPEDPRTAERFELFYQGVELANGYHELLDASILRARNADANRRRSLDGKPMMPEKSRLLDAMEAGLPPCCGCALGFDRIVMLSVGATTLRDVLCFPWDRA